MQYLDFNIIKQAVNDGVNIQALLNSLLYEDSLGIYDYDKDKLIYEIFTFEDILEFMENMENMESMESMENGYNNDIEDIREWVLLIYYTKWYYMNSKGIKWFSVSKLSNDENYKYKMVIRIEDYGNNRTEIIEEYFEDEDSLLRRIEWSSVGKVLYVDFIDYDLPKEIKEYFKNNEGRWVKFKHI